LCFFFVSVVDSVSSQDGISCAVIKSDKKKRSNPLIQSVLHFLIFWHMKHTCIFNYI